MVVPIIELLTEHMFYFSLFLLITFISVDGIIIIIQQYKLSYSCTVFVCVFLFFTHAHIVICLQAVKLAPE
jgi:hypothetical protein